MHVVAEIIRLLLHARHLAGGHFHHVFYVMRCSSRLGSAGPRPVLPAAGASHCQLFRFAPRVLSVRWYR